MKIDIPSWLMKSLGQLACPHCAAKMTAGNVAGIGIRRSSKFKDKSVFFFEYNCSKCDKNAFMEMDFMTVEDFVMQMVDEYIDKDGKPEKSSKANSLKSKESKAENSSTKSNITDADLKKISNCLDKMKTWDDLLGMLGYTSEEIDLNKKVGENERKAYKGSSENKDV